MSASPKENFAGELSEGAGAGALRESTRVEDTDINVLAPLLNASAT